MRVELLKRQLYKLWKRAWLILLISAFFTLISAIVSFYIIEPEYQVFTTILVGRPQNDDERISYNQILLNEKMIRTYKEIAGSRKIADEVINNLSLSIKYEGFRKKMEISVLKDTEILKIVITDENPEIAAKIANETAQVLKKYMEELINISNIYIIDEAKIPSKPFKPNSALNMSLACILGGMLGVIIISLYDLLNNTIKDIGDVEKHLNLIVVGSIYKMKVKSDNVNKKQNRIIRIKDNPKSLSAESFRTLRTNLQFISFEKNIRSIVITSSVPKEGKSTISINLAYALALVNKRVLIVDGDLRKPNIHNFFDMDNFNGLTRILLEDIDYYEAIHSIEENFDVLTSGPIPPNPSELLESKKMKEFIENVKENYDVVIFDSPPTGLVSDGIVLSKITDGTVLVCEYKKTLVQELINTKQKIENVKANILGVIVNKVPLTSGLYYDKKYGDLEDDVYYYKNIMEKEDNQNV